MRTTLWQAIFMALCIFIPVSMGRKIQNLPERCEQDYWKTDSGKGCEHCDCDTIGSTSRTCNLSTGQCDCKEGFKGRKCDECEQDYWKTDSGKGCEHCDCNTIGSTSTTCNLSTGQCDCKEGFKGWKCNEFCIKKQAGLEICGALGIKD